MYLLIGRLKPSQTGVFVARRNSREPHREFGVTGSAPLEHHEHVSVIGSCGSLISRILLTAEICTTLAASTN